MQMSWSLSSFYIVTGHKIYFSSCQGPLTYFTRFNCRFLLSSFNPFCTRPIYPVRVSIAFQIWFSCEDAALQVLISLHKTKPTSNIVMQRTSCLSPFLFCVDKWKSQASGTHTTWTFCLCAFLFCHPST